MLARLQKLIRGFAPGGPARPRYVFDEADHRVAAAGLLVYAMNVDGVQSPVEKARAAALLQERFALDEDETRALLAAADERNRDALDFNDFTGVVKRAYSQEGRQRIIEMMWQIAFADGSLHEFEDNLVWRVAEALDVPAAARAAIRNRVAVQNDVLLPEAGE
ncbi:tellurite resistance TerB family protein [Labrys neptuniae]